MSRQPKSCRLVGERLIVRLPQASDAAGIIAYYRENERHLARFGSAYPEGFLSKSFWSQEIARRQQDLAADNSCMTFLFAKNDTVVIGAANLTAIIRGYFHAAYLGYTLAEKEQGKGLMHDGLALLIRFAFDELNLHRIMANYMPSNAHSQAVLERLGFEVEGKASKYLLINGVWEDHVLTSLANPQWRAPESSLN